MLKIFAAVKNNGKEVFNNFKGERKRRQPNCLGGLVMTVDNRTNISTGDAKNWI